MIMVANFVNNIKTTTQRYKPFLKCYASMYKIELVSLLFKQNFIRGFFLKKYNNKNHLFILFRYDTEIITFKSLSIINKNQNCTQLLKKENGLGFSILSTTVGLMPILKAKKSNIGGCKLIKIN